MTRIAFSLFGARRGALCAGLALAWAAAALGQGVAGPQPAPMPPPIATPADTPYPGTISLLADLSDFAHRVVNVRETIPVEGSEVTLLYPEWIPGNHSPTGPISSLAGLTIRADGQRVAWVRDRVDVYAFHVRVPAGAKTLDVRFEYLSPASADEGRVTISSNLADLAWNTVLLYPAGYFSRRIEFAPAVRLPQGWKYATALETQAREGDLVRFAPTTLNTLVDSPLYAGANYERVDLSPSAANRVYLDVFADTPAELKMTPAEREAHRSLAAQAERLFASHHYDHYDFLLALSDTIGGEGLEHHQSSEDATHGNYFTDWAAGVSGSDLLSHEYTHSWNGKFRRPADLWTPNFNVPMRDDLLWVYEGLTQYYGYVLAARSGLRTPQQTRDLIARIAADFEASPGRQWRPLVDTTNQPTMSQRAPVSWASWQRGEDYYQEGLLIWLEADTKIRELSGGKRSLDDFAKLFYGRDNGSFVTETYTFNDVVAALNQVQAYDWAQFLRRRVYELAPQVPENGIAQGGYRLIYNDTEPPWQRLEKRRGGPSFATSVGFSVTDEGDVSNVGWNSPAFQAGMRRDMRVVAVNGQAFSLKGLREAIVAAEGNAAPILLLLRDGDSYVTAAIDYHRGLRYPHLERVAGTPDRLDAILAPLP